MSGETMSESADAMVMGERKRSGRTPSKRTRSRRAGDTPKPFYYLTIALLAWLPLPIGGHHDRAISLAACLTGLLQLPGAGRLAPVAGTRRAVRAGAGGTVTAGSSPGSFSSDPATCRRTGASDLG
jgi:hypothetical protein